MQHNLRTLIRERLAAEELLQTNWATLVLAGCDGRAALEAVLTRSEAPVPPTEVDQAAPKSGAYLSSVTVEGFRGIGPKQTLKLAPGPGLTVIVGRNGSGKSSFAEALEVAFTGNSNRWLNRPKIWKEGWRNLHQPDPARIEVEVLLEGQGPASMVSTWEKNAALDDQKAFVQPKGKRKTTIEELGWDGALKLYRPFLSYNELGSMLDEGPSKLYDALSTVLGLEELVTAQEALAKSRLERQRPLDEAKEGRESLVAALEELLENDSDHRASGCLEALSQKNWGLDALAQLLSAATVRPADDEINVLTRAVALEIVDAARVAAVVQAVRSAAAKLQALAGTDAERARQLATLLDQALAFHSAHGDDDCPVCGRDSALNATWAHEARRESTRFKEAAASSAQAHRAADEALRSARELMSPPPRLFTQLFEIGLDGLAAARDAWTEWHSAHGSADLVAVADHLERAHEPLVEAVNALRKAAAVEVQRREDRWRPIATALEAWLPTARDARAAAEDIPRIKQAETWLKDASAELRNQRFAPIADQAMETWQHLRQQSNVELGRIELVGTKAQRRVSLDVTVDGVPGAALGVMSQGELHALALSLFLPRATLPDSPFRFVVIDDPVQSMDPARVDGLARALEDTAKTRQVIVFTHDDRLAEAVRRLTIKCSLLSVTRRPKSVVEVRCALDPVKASIEDALALVHTTELPRDILRRLVPGFCRAALEATLMTVVRKQKLAAGMTTGDIEEQLKAANKLTPLAALAFFGDKDRGSDVLRRVNQYGTWAGDVFQQCKEGVHVGVTVDLNDMIKDTERLTERVLERV